MPKRPHLRNESFNSASVRLPSGSRLVLTVPLNSKGSCGMADRFFRTASKPIVARSTPSMMILPFVNSTSRKRACTQEDLPAPVLPTIPICNSSQINCQPSQNRLYEAKIPTFCPGLTWNDNPFKTSGRSDRYRSSTSSNVRSPLEGQVASGSVSLTGAASTGSPQ